jgi:hypothetical protein
MAMQPWSVMATQSNIGAHGISAEPPLRSIPQRTTSRQRADSAKVRSNSEDLPEPVLPPEIVCLPPQPLMYQATLIRLLSSVGPISISS